VLYIAYQLPLCHHALVTLPSFSAGGRLATLSILGKSSSLQLVVPTTMSERRLLKLSREVLVFKTRGSLTSLLLKPDSDPSWPSGLDPILTSPTSTLSPFTSMSFIYRQKPSGPPNLRQYTKDAILPSLLYGPDYEILPPFAGGRNSNRLSVRPETSRRLEHIYPLDKDIWPALERCMYLILTLSISKF